ncbi:MAG: Eco57I restriction-modification methylase domain-containing protein, partial [Methanosarcinales archaeon]
MEEIEEIKNTLRKELDLELLKYLKKNNLPSEILNKTKPLHWALEFWYVFFKENGEALSVQERGFDAVVGNPPYISVKRGIPKEIDSFLKEHYHSAKKQYDEYCTFMERAIDLSRFNASISYIVPIPMLSNENMLPIREYILKNCLIKNLADFGFVFEDADVESAVFVFEKKHYVPKGSHRFLFEQRKENEKINAWFVDQKSFLELPNLMFNISLSIEVSDLLNKIEKEANPLEFYFSITRGIEAGKDSISFSKDSKLHVPTLRGEDVRKYEISYQNTYTLFDETNTTKFKDKRIYKTKEKLLVRRVSSNLISTVDKSQFFNLNTLYNLINDKESIDMKYSCALLNSNLLNFWFKNKYVFNEKLFPYIRISQLNTVPIYPATPDQQKPIIELVDKIINLKKSRHKLLDLWKEWSKKLKNKEYTLHKILEEDANNLRTGNFDKTWTLKVTFYPNMENELLNQEFKNFKVIGDKEKPILRIYGLDELNKEELIYEIKFYKREIMQHIYFSIIALLGSRMKVKSLKALFAKTVIPIIQPDAIINTANIIKKVEYEHQDLDIVKIDNEIEDIEAQIDALVFKLYGLEEVDVQTVMDSLNVQGLYKHKVLEYFNN